MSSPLSVVPYILRILPPWTERDYRQGARQLKEFYGL